MIIRISSKTSSLNIIEVKLIFIALKLYILGQFLNVTRQNSRLYFINTTMAELKHAP